MIMSNPSSFTENGLPPIFQTYLHLRAQTDALLGFQMGSFFEFFFDDAMIVAEVCGLRLVHRGQVPMCVFPASAIFPEATAGDVAFVGSSAQYFAAIVAAGYPVAVCLQTAERTIAATFRPANTGKGVLA